jgi:hypothetical protein
MYVCVCICGEVKYASHLRQYKVVEVFGKLMKLRKLSAGVSMVIHLHFIMLPLDGGLITEYIPHSSAHNKRIIRIVFLGLASSRQKDR